MDAARPRHEGEPDREALVVEVRAGAVTVSTVAPSVVFTPADVSRLRRALLEAQAAALIERGHW